jgi:hypothetical protein
MLQQNQQHFGGGNFLKTATWNTKHEMGGNIKIRFREIGCRDGILMVVAQDRVRWLVLVG